MPMRWKSCACGENVLRTPPCAGAAGLSIVQPPRCGACVAAGPLGQKLAGLVAARVSHVATNRKEEDSAQPDKPLASQHPRCTAESVERIGLDFGALPPPAMIDAEGFFVRRERSFRHCKGLWCSAFRKPQAGEMDSRSIGVGMLGAERLLADRRRPLEERPRAGQVALGVKQKGEVVGSRRYWDARG